MKEFVKYHSTNPIKVKLPSNGYNSFIDVFVVNYNEVKNQMRLADYEISLEIHGYENFKYLTEKIIKFYISKTLDTQFKLFSVDSCKVDYKMRFN